MTDSVMKGCNEIRLNPLSMQQAMQLWIDDQFKLGCAPKVSNVRALSGPGCSTEFIIETVDRDNLA